MSDMIYRDDAIDLVLTYFIPRSHTGERGEHEEDFVRTIFKALPSADAEPKWNCTANFVAEQLEKLKDMTDEERIKLLHILFPSADAEPSLKAIKRQIDEHWYLDPPSAEAVQIPIKLEKRYPESKDEDITDAFMRGYLAGRSSAEAVQGEWIDIDNYYRMATCSHCHKVTMFEKWGEYTKPYNYCPNCGARMKGGEDE